MIDDDGTHCYSASSYVKRLVEQYERVYGELPKQYTSPMPLYEHPEIDVSELLDDRGIS